MIDYIDKNGNTILEYDIEEFLNETIQENDVDILPINEIEYLTYNNKISEIGDVISACNVDNRHMLNTYLTLAIEWHNAFGVKYNAHKDGEEFATFIRYILPVLRNLLGIADLNWIETSDVTNMDHLFANCDIDIDISEWDMSNVDTAIDMFKNYTGAYKKNDELNEGTIGLLSLNDDPEDTDMQLQKVSALYDIDRHNKMAAKIYYSDKLQEMIPSIGSVNLTYDDIVNIEKWHKEYGVTYNPHVDGILSHFKKFIDNCILTYINCGFDTINLNWIDTSEVKDMSSLFIISKYNNINKRYKDIDISEWDVSNVTSMSYMFTGVKGLCCDLSNWDVSNVETMEEMFGVTGNNNMNISTWDVSNVTNMLGMFYGANITEDISSWDVSGVKDMSYMFYISQFNGDISGWDVSNVRNMCGMFYGSKFNGDISNWNVSEVINMGDMFMDSIFNGDISNWNVSNVKAFDNMFKNSIFNGDISKWQLCSVDSMKDLYVNGTFNGFDSEKMPVMYYEWLQQNNKDVMNESFNALSFDDEDFDTEDIQLQKASALYDIERHNKMAAKIYYTDKLEEMISDQTSITKEIINQAVEWYELYGSLYNPHLDGQDFHSFVKRCVEVGGDKVNLNWIDTSDVTDMHNLFYFSNFDGDISEWDVSNVKNMNEMFKYSSFKGDISNWDVSNVKTMCLMFHVTYFNGDLSKWNVSNVEDMYGMFCASYFHNNISNWHIKDGACIDSMFSDCMSMPYDFMPYKICIKDAIDESYNFNALSFDDEDFEDDMQLLKVTALYDIDRHNKMAAKIYYNDKFEELIPDPMEITKKTIDQAIEWYSQCGALFNPHLDGITFRKFIHKCIKVKGDKVDLNWLNTSDVTDMRYLFHDTNFNGDISKWDVSNVVNMNSLFLDSTFNGDISNWDVSKAKDMERMFWRSKFNMDISNWNINSIAEVFDMFTNCPIKEEYKPKFK